MRGSGGLAPAAAARRLDPQPVAGLELALALRRQGLAVQRVGARRTVAARGAAARRMPPALGDQREAHRRQRLELANDAVAAAMAAAAAAPAPEPELADPQGELCLERLDGRVKRVRHRDVDRARPVCVRAGALPAADRLVVREPLAGE